MNELQLRDEAINVIYRVNGKNFAFAWKMEGDGDVEGLKKYLPNLMQQMIDIYIVESSGDKP